MKLEEKKAIEILEAVGIECNGIDVYKTIKNLIENQQKENGELRQRIKELEIITNQYNAYKTYNNDKIIIADKQYFDKGIFTEQYINKGKIREKIEKLELECKICNVSNLIDCKKQCTIGRSIEVLKELLED